MEEKRFTIKQVSELKGIAVSTLKLMCKQGRIPSAVLVEVPFGNGYWMIPERSLDKIQLKDRGRPPTKKG